MKKNRYNNYANRNNTNYGNAGQNRSNSGNGRKATLNARTVDGSFTQAGSQVAIEGEVGYESMCGTCYLHNVGTLG